jgi:hypothetical protein
MRQLNEVTTINRQQQQQRVKYNQTDGFNPKTSPENQKAITINNSVSRSIPVEEESLRRKERLQITQTGLKQQQQQQQ